LLNELKAEQMPGLNPTGKRMTVAVGPTGQMEASIYRTGSTNEEVIRVLAKYGIEESTEAELPKSTR
jgi:hypothetical protein